MNIDGLKGENTVIINKELYYKEPLKENILSLFYDVDNEVVTIGMYYKYNEQLKKHMSFCLATASFFFTKGYSLKSTDKDDYDIINDSIGSSDRFYHNLKYFYKTITYQALDEGDKEKFLKYSRFYKNLKNEMECVKWNLQ